MNKKLFARLAFFACGFLLVWMPHLTSASPIEGSAQTAHGGKNWELVDAVKKGDLLQTRFLLEHGEDPNVEEDEASALLLAVEAGRLNAGINSTPIVRALLNKGAHVNATDKQGWTALMLSVDFGRSDLVYVLLAKKADVNAHNVWGATALMQTVLSVSDNGAFALRTLRALLKHGVQVNATNDEGKTALMDVVCCGATDTGPSVLNKSAYLPLVRTLLEHGARVNMKDEYGQTALLMARQYGTPDIVRLLKQAGASE